MVKGLDNETVRVTILAQMTANKETFEQTVHRVRGAHAGVLNNEGKVGVKGALPSEHDYSELKPEVLVLQQFLKTEDERQKAEREVTLNANLTGEKRSVSKMSKGKEHQTEPAQAESSKKSKVSNDRDSPIDQASQTDPMSKASTSKLLKNAVKPRPKRDIIG
jgi:hypothetical protein